MKTGLVLSAGLIDYPKALRWQEYLAEARQNCRIDDILLFVEKLFGGVRHGL